MFIYREKDGQTLKKLSFGKRNLQNFLSLLMRSGETERDTHVLVTPFGSAQYYDDDK